MKTTVLSAIALGALTALALAPADRAVAEPFELNAAQMDSVTGGIVVILILLPLGEGEISKEIMAPVGGIFEIDLNTSPPTRNMSINPPRDFNG